MDPYKLAVWCIFITCLIYWVYSLIIFSIKRHTPSKPRQIISDLYDNMYYLVEGKTISHIPDWSTFEYLGAYFSFSRADAKKMSPEDIDRKFIKGKQLPSILSHCPK